MFGTGLDSELTGEEALLVAKGPPKGLLTPKKSSNSGTTMAMHEGWKTPSAEQQSPSNSISGVKVRSWSRNWAKMVKACVRWSESTSLAAWNLVLTNRGLGRRADGSDLQPTDPPRLTGEDKQRKLFSIRQMEKRSPSIILTLIFLPCGLRAKREVNVPLGCPYRSLNEAGRTLAILVSDAPQVGFSRLLQIPDIVLLVTKIFTVLTVLICDYAHEMNHLNGLLGSQVGFLLSEQAQAAVLSSEVSPFCPPDAWPLFNSLLLTASSILANIASSFSRGCAKMPLDSATSRERSLKLFRYSIARELMREPTAGLI